MLRNRRLHVSFLCAAAASLPQYFPQSFSHSVSHHHATFPSHQHSIRSAVADSVTAAEMAMSRALALAPQSQELERRREAEDERRLVPDKRQSQEPMPRRRRRRLGSRGIGGSFSRQTFESRNTRLRGREDGGRGCICSFRFSLSLSLVVRSFSRQATSCQVRGVREESVQICLKLLFSLPPPNVHLLFR